MNDNRCDIAITIARTSIHGLPIVVSGTLCYHGLHTFLLALAMNGTQSSMISMYVS